MSKKHRHAARAVAKATVRADSLFGSLLKKSLGAMPTRSAAQVGHVFLVDNCLGMSTQAWTWHPNEINLTFSTGC